MEWQVTFHLTRGHRAKGVRAVVELPTFSEEVGVSLLLERRSGQNCYKILSSERFT